MPILLQSPRSLPSLLRAFINLSPKELHTVSASLKLKYSGAKEDLSICADIIGAPTDLVVLPKVLLKVSNLNPNNSNKGINCFELLQDIVHLSPKLSELLENKSN